MMNINFLNSSKSFRLFMFLHLVLLIGVSSYLKDDPNVVGIPFNLPDTRYCGPCKLTDNVPLPDEGLDKFCLEYVYMNMNVMGRENNFDSLRLLLGRFQEIGHTYYNLLKYYIEAKEKFEVLYNSTYNYSVYVVSTPHDSACIKVFQQGRGFQERELDLIMSRPNSNELFPDMTRETAQQSRQYLEGLSNESKFLQFLTNIWVVKTCHASTNLYEFQHASKSWAHMHSLHIPRSPKPTTVLDSPYFKPAISERFARPCADNVTVPNGILEDIEECREMFCLATSPKPVLVPSNTNADANKENQQPRRFVINEFYPFNPQYPNEEEFIEIRVVPPHIGATNKFSTMKIVAFTVYTKKLLLQVNLIRLSIPDNGLFFIQGSNLPASYIQTSDDPNKPYKLLPPGDEPVAIVLLEKTSRLPDSNWERIQLQKVSNTRRRSLDMAAPKNADIITSMHRYVIDAVFYGVLRNAEVPDDVRQILPPSVSGCNYILPRGDVSLESEMKSSYNLCGEFDPPSPFQFDKFKLGSPSMGTPNNCNPMVTPQVHKVEQQTSNAELVGVTVDPSKPQDCPRVESGIGDVIIQIESSIKYIKEHHNPMYSSRFYPTSKFTSTVWPQFLNQLTRGTYVRQLNLNPFEEHPVDDPLYGPRPIAGTKLIRCSICHRRLTTCPASVSYNQKRGGFVVGRQMPTDLSAMKIAFESHLKSLAHLTSVLYEVEKDRIKYQTDSGEHSYRFNQTEKFRKLANIIDITFTFLHTNTAPTNAAIWYRTLTKIQAEVGASHHSRQTAFAIIKFIAEVGTAAITTQLIANDEPFTLILDGSSDRRNYHYVLVYLQCLEGGVTIPYLFFQLELKTSFTAQDYLDALQAAVTAKGNYFNEYFKRRLVGVVTDSASVMKRFHRLLNTWLQRKDAKGEPLDVVSIYCLAHKLQLASRSAIVPLKTDRDTPIDSSLVYFSILEKNMQQLYVWFKWSAKRIGLFREVSEFPKLELKELHVERWISSEYNTVRNFILSWKTARTSIERMAGDNRLDKRTIREAAEYLPLFKDKTALITLHFLWDYTSVFKIWSEYLQKMSGLIIDQRKYFDQLMENLSMLEEYRSPVLLQFLKSTKCGEQECTLELFESSNSVTWNDMEFSSQNEDAPTFTVAATALLTKTRERLRIYIPLDLIFASDILRPQRFPPGSESLNYQHPMSPGQGERRIYGENEIRSLSKLLGFESESILEEWAEFVLSLQRSTSWETVRQIGDSNMFWAVLLKDTSLSWTSNLKLFIKTIKTLAPGSVACETGFSIFNVIKSQRRVNLKDSNVEDMMKILINGPSNIEMFDSFRYANYWVLGGHKLPKDDDEVTENVCQPQDRQITIENDVGYNEPDIEMFPGQSLDNPYSDAYIEFSRTQEFLENNQDQRTKSRFRSSIM